MESDSPLWMCVRQLHSKSDSRKSQCSVDGMPYIAFGKRIFHLTNGERISALLSVFHLPFQLNFSWQTLLNHASDREWEKKERHWGVDYSVSLIFGRFRLLFAASKISPFSVQSKIAIWFAALVWRRVTCNIWNWDFARLLVHKTRSTDANLISFRITIDRRVVAAAAAVALARVWRIKVTVMCCHLPFSFSFFVESQLRLYFWPLRY